MSLIFQSLQKTQSALASEDADTGHPVAEPSQTSSSLISWLRPVALGLAVLAIGGVAVYAVQNLKGRLPQEAMAGNTDTASEAIKPVVYQPVAVPVADSPSPMAANPGIDDRQARFYPPEPEAPRDPEPETTASVAMVKPENENPVPGGDASASKLLPEAKMEKIDTGPAETAVEATGPEPPDFAAEREAARKAQRKAIEKREDIGRLVRQIEEAIAGGVSDVRTKDLLERLGRMKGRSDPFVAKLRAYWHLHRKQYAFAETELQKVIAAHPEDLEAGINMALVEIHRQHYTEALVRLKKLRLTHPEDAAIADLIKRLQ